MNIQRTGVFATQEETDEVLRLHKIARETPVIALSMAHGLERGGFAGEAWDHMQKTCHQYALAHGLPEIQGYYGMDPSNREFITT